MRRGLLRGERPSHDQVNLQPRGRLDDVAHPAQVVYARQLHQDLVGAQVVLLDSRFGDSQVIDAGANSVDRLLQRMLLDRLHLGLLHGEGPVIVRRRRYRVLGSIAGVEQAAHVADLVRGRSLNLN